MVDEKAGNVDEIWLWVLIPMKIPFLGGYSHPF